VASTFNEALLNDYLLKKITKKDERMYLLNHYLEEFRGTVFRQTMFSEFERQIHEAVESGGALTASSLSDMYLELNRQYFEPEVKVDKKISLEWARIPHFYMNFYVFQYSTGFCAAVALAKNVLAGTAGAREKYIEFLSSGSSDYAINLLAKAGVDMTTEKPITDALDVFEGLLDELEALI
ncbi:MAG TPA: M3 family metallopeptidase, partial [Bacillota bacterium]|nr:M3 family metallopeptidase [Bacillota bacterium]